MINSAAISRMKKGVVIVNTSRGGLIDAEALLEGIKARHVGAACLDVYEEEEDLFFEDREDWDKMVIRDMEKDVSWKKSAEQYRQLYVELTQ